MPLTKYIQQIERKYPKFTHYNLDSDVFDPAGALLKKEYYNDYCFIELFDNGNNVRISFFSCDYSDTNKLEVEFVEHSLDFIIDNPDQIKTIVDCLV